LRYQWPCWLRPYLVLVSWSNGTSGPPWNLAA